MKWPHHKNTDIGFKGDSHQLKWSKFKLQNTDVNRLWVWVPQKNSNSTQAKLSFEVKLSANKIIANGKEEEKLGSEMFRQILTKSEEQSKEPL